MSKKILVLGGSVNQLPAINAAVSLGIETHVADNIPENPGHKIATVSHNIDTTDIEAICGLFAREQYHGILSPCTDVAVLTAATVAEKFSLIGVPVKAAKILTSKILFRKFQLEQGLPCPSFQEISNTNSVNLNQSWQGLVVKPDKSSGSKGISILDKKSFGEIDNAINLAVENSLNSRVHLEQVILGHHGTLEGVMIDGKITHSFFLDRQIVDWQKPCTIGHRYPSILAKQPRKQLLEQISDIFLKLDIHNAIFDVDFVVSENDRQVYIIEMSPRLGGNSISELIHLATMVNLPKLAISMAISGEIPSYHHVADYNIGVALLGVDSEGKLGVNDQLLNQFSKRQDILKVTLNSNSGDAVSAFTTGRDVVASVFFKADNSQSLAELEFEIRNQKFFSVSKSD